MSEARNSLAAKRRAENSIKNRFYICQQTPQQNIFVEAVKQIEHVFWKHVRKQICSVDGTVLLFMLENFWQPVLCQRLLLSPFLAELFFYVGKDNALHKQNIRIVSEQHSWATLDSCTHREREALRWSCNLFQKANQSLRYGFWMTIFRMMLQKKII